MQRPHIDKTPSLARPPSTSRTHQHTHTLSISRALTTRPHNNILSGSSRLLPTQSTLWQITPCASFILSRYERFSSTSCAMRIGSCHYTRQEFGNRQPFFLTILKIKNKKKKEGEEVENNHQDLRAQRTPPHDPHRTSS